MKRLINQTPTPMLRVLLGLLPFVLLVLLYMFASEARLAENPSDKLLPSFTQIGDAIQRMAFEPSKRSGDYLFWEDTLSSLTRLGMGVLIASAIGLALGLFTGALPLVSASASPLLTVVSLIPPLAILPVLFIVFGLGELSKVALIAIGITPFIARDIQRRTQEIPSEQLVKAQTLGANTSQIVCRVLLPQLMPRLVDAVRLSLGAGWLFLIAAEAIAATEGLGYRIFLVRRYMAMDVILPYVAWITLLAFVIDALLATLSRRLFPWHHQGGQ
ncbi:MAG TPA: lipid kinase [Halieaceae bacterium]|jgi:NitT/TauT family transport system permease protein|uniref:ABC transporter permease n=1 Tax=Haliea TaxID=475794 RepID=UPI000C3D38B4|nr:ABC transporter permease subunit [Haliea sp.]HBQ39624.1 lipid kinase [Halieaceae bacterium]MAD64272.1 lipid kinase [Haliea sp.]MAY93313.1 lipid kinase [Haliea sp.]MBK39902.1 lipid kinase [Haliea sp.]MBP71203.1 lipid kinase [Haliea sp.]|tara:strand:- start:289 stop:1107 length:819 start_codon:yes stop_codon:yes gene_type:complete